MHRIVFVVILTCISFSAFSQKVAVIDETAVLNDLPEAKKIEAEIKELIRSWSDTAAAYEKLITARKEALKNATATLSPEARRNAVDTISRMQQMLSTYTLSKQDAANGELVQERARRYAPILERYKVAVREVARREKIDIVIAKLKTAHIGTATIEISDKVKNILMNN
jgi:Skp family chaperone for outer membrane proteins